MATRTAHVEHSRHPALPRPVPDDWMAREAQRAAGKLAAVNAEARRYAEQAEAKKKADELAPGAPLHVDALVEMFLRAGFGTAEAVRRGAKLREECAKITLPMVNRSEPHAYQAAPPVGTMPRIRSVVVEHTLNRDRRGLAQGSTEVRRYHYDGEVPPAEKK